MKLNEVKPDSANYRLRVEYMKQDSKPRKCKCGFIGPVLDPEDISEGFRVTTSSTQKLYVSKKCLRCVRKKNREDAAKRSSKKIKSRDRKPMASKQYKNDLRLISDAHTDNVIKNLWKCSCQTHNRDDRKVCRGCGKKRPVK